MCESTAPSKRKRILKICIIILSVIIALLSVISVLAYFLFPRARYGFIAHKNYEAQRIEFEVSEHLDTLLLPQNETVILMGEYVWGEHLMIYANQWIAQDKYIYHSEPFKDTNYWAMRITENSREVWYAEQPIDESQLHQYTYAEQENDVHFFTPFTSLSWYSTSWTDDSELIGYYHHILESK